MRTLFVRLAIFLLSGGLAGIAFCGDTHTKREEPQIQDNSFLIEEAYNQERGILQHISTFSRLWNSKDWSYTFTQEWPSPRDWRHQFSYTLVGMHSGDDAASGSGMGDMIFNYRYQLLGDGDSRVAFAPRLSVLLPTGDVVSGRGSGGFGVQTNLPVSVILHRRLVTHWNLGGTLVPRAQSPDRVSARSAAYSFGQSVIFVAHPRFNLMFETLAGGYQSVVGANRTEWVRTAYLSPGVRWAFNFACGLQIVPGIAAPVGIGPSAGEHGVILYLSFEHPFSRTGER